MKTIIALITLIILYMPSLAQQKDIATLKSPNGRITMNIYQQHDSILKIAVLKDNMPIIDSIECKLNLYKYPNTNLINASRITKTETGQYNGTIESNLWERASQPNSYATCLLHLNTDTIQLQISIRIYNEGIATSISSNDINKNFVINYSTTYYWTQKNMTAYVEEKNELKYLPVRMPYNIRGVTPCFILSKKDSLMILISEAANHELFSRASINIKGDATEIYQRGEYNIGQYTTPWHYAAFSHDAKEYLESRYIIRSLNNDSEGDFSWVKPGKVYRHMGTSEEDFATEKVKESIDFAHKMNFEYLLLDNGWYGLGYQKEFDGKSNPCQAVAPLNLEEAIKYANKFNIGILLYINKTALYHYNRDSIINYIQQTGAKGIKFGFVSNRSKADNTYIKAIIKQCAIKKLLLNIHDEYRPTGVERQYPNLITCEGIRGNEHRDNDAHHTLLLPFIRYMTGPADYTICYEAANGDSLKLNTSKGHQLALSVIYFSPLQHLLWYGKPSWYGKAIEVEMLKNLPTVWDHYKIIEACPHKVFSIARKKDNQWYIATATGKGGSVNTQLPLKDISSRNCKAVIYEDNGSGGISKRETSYQTGGMIEIKVPENSGQVIILTEH